MYKELLEQIDTPFDEAFQRKLQWYEYQGYLENKRHQQLFNEAFTLEDVYVPLLCYFLQPSEESKRLTKDGPHKSVSEQSMVGFTEKSVHLLDDYLDNWLEELSADYPADDDVERVKQALRIVTGGPGSGKSTTVRRFAARLRESRPDVYPIYIPLHQFEFTEQLESGLDKFCEFHEPPLPQGLLKREATEQNLLLIFDGLDELSK